MPGGLYEIFKVCAEERNGKQENENLQEGKSRERQHRVIVMGGQRLELCHLLPCPIVLLPETCSGVKVGGPVVLNNLGFLTPHLSTLLNKF